MDFLAGMSVKTLTVLEFVAEAAGVDSRTLTLGTRFMDLPLDSLEFLELVKKVEDEYEIIVDVSDINTIADLCAAVGC